MDEWITYRSLPVTYFVASLCRYGIADSDRRLQGLRHLQDKMAVSACLMRWINTIAWRAYTLEPACKVHVLSNENWPYKQADLISGLLASIRILDRDQPKKWPYMQTDLIFPWTLQVGSSVITASSPKSLSSRQNAVLYQILPSVAKTRCE